MSNSAWECDSISTRTSVIMILYLQGCTAQNRRPDEDQCPIPEALHRVRPKFWPCHEPHQHMDGKIAKVFQSYQRHTGLYNLFQRVQLRANFYTVWSCSKPSFICLRISWIPVINWIVATNFRNRNYCINRCRSFSWQKIFMMTRFSWASQKFLAHE